MWEVDEFEFGAPKPLGFQALLSACPTFTNIQDVEKRRKYLGNL